MTGMLTMTVTDVTPLPAPMGTDSFLDVSDHMACPSAPTLPSRPLASRGRVIADTLAAIELQESPEGFHLDSLTEHKSTVRPGCSFFAVRLVAPSCTVEWLSDPYVSRTGAMA